MEPMTWPDVPIARAAEQLLAAVKVKNVTPERWEILFGEGVLEALALAGPAKMRSVTKLQSMYDLPVSFPEEPGPRPLVMELRLLGEPGGAQAGLHVEHLLA